MRRPPSKDNPTDKPLDGLKPSDIEKMGFFVGNRVHCVIWTITDNDEIEGKTIKVTFNKDTFKYKGKEYNIIFTHKQWRKASRFGNRQLTLNYKEGEPNPISYRLPSIYVDASLQQEIHRRRSLRSLLNKIETIVLVIVIFAMIAAASGTGLYIWGAVEKQRTDRLNAALTAENAQLKALLDRLEIPGEAQ